MAGFVGCLAGRPAGRAVRRRGRRVTMLSELSVGQVEDGEGVKSAFGALSEQTKVGAVIEALCREGQLDDALLAVEQLEMKEMRLSSRSKRVIIDCAVTGAEPAALVQAMSTLAPCLRYFGQLSARFEPNATLQVVPEEQAATEVLVASIFLALTGGSLSMEVYDAATHHSAALPTLVILAELAFLTFDASQGRKLLVQILGGLTRIFQNDPLRRCRIEAGTFLVGYLLGIPLPCYRPNVESFRIAVPTPAPEDVDTYLVWAMAGPASEVGVDGKLLETDSSTASRLLKSLSREQRVDFGVEWVWEQKERIQWAFKQASEVLRSNSSLHAELERRMLSGASVGECVECIETF